MMMIYNIDYGLNMGYRTHVFLAIYFDETKLKYLYCILKIALYFCY